MVDLQVASLGLAGERADEVVRLPALELVDGDAEGLDELAHLGELVAQVVGHLATRRLVVGEGLVAEGRRRRGRSRP